jgi:hypothetical protein
MQFVEIAGGTLPMLLLSAAGYAPLGGCTCGCGVSCGRAIGHPYARWHCPNDVGYSCTGSFGSPLLYAPEPQVAPCAAQGDDVQGLITLFFLAVPGALALVAALPASRMPITAHAHAAIRAALAARAASPGIAVHDPLSGAPVRLPPNTPASLFEEHFSRRELEFAARPGRLRALLCSRLAVWLALAGLLLAAMLYSGEAVITFGCLALSVLFMLMPWDAVRPCPKHAHSARVDGGKHGKGTRWGEGNALRAGPAPTSCPSSSDSARPRSAPPNSSFKPSS